MSYVDGFVLVVPKKQVKAYRGMAKKAGKVWKRHGAVGYFECIGDDLAPQLGDGPAPIGFPALARLKRNETVWFSFIVYKSRAHRDRVNAKVMKDPAMHSMPNPMPFDPKRMAWGGFRAVVES